MERRRLVRAFVLVPGGRGAEMRTGLFLTLFSALAGAALFPGEFGTAACWLPALWVGLCGLWAASSGKGLFRLSASEVAACAVWGGCLAADAASDTFAPSAAWWRTVLLGFLLLMRRSSWRFRACSQCLCVLTLGCALYRAAESAGLVREELFCNSSGYAAALALGVPFLAGEGMRAWSARRWKALAGSCVAAAVVGWALWSADSRSAWFALLLAGGFAAGERFRSRLTKKVLVRAVPVALLLCGFVLLLLYRMRPASARGRLLVYRVTADYLLRAPWGGHGSAGFRRDYMFGQAAYLADRADAEAGRLAGNVSYPFNEVLGFGVAYGLWGLALAGTAVFLLLRDVVRSARLSRAERCVVLSAWVVVAGMGLFSYPLSHPYVALAALACLGTAGGSSLPRRAFSAGPWGRWFVAAGSACLLGAATLRAVAEWNWKRGRADLAAGATERGFDRYARAYPFQSDRPEFLYNYAAELNGAERYAESDRLLKRCTRYLNNLDTELLAADNCLARERSGEAEGHLCRAAAMVPSRFMPLGGLLFLYRESGDTVRERAVARRILEKEVKVPSPDVDEIKAAARESLRPARRICGVPGK